MEHHKSEYPATALEISAASFTATDVRISDHKLSSLHTLRWWLVRAKVKIQEFLPKLVRSTPGINDTSIISRNAIQFSSHLLTCWLNSSIVTYNVQIQHKCTTTKHRTKQQQNKSTTDTTAFHINRSHYVSLHYTANADSATTHISHDRHPLHINTPNTLQSEKYC